MGNTPTPQSHQPYHPTISRALPPHHLTSPTTSPSHQPYHPTISPALPPHHLTSPTTSPSHEPYHPTISPALPPSPPQPPQPPHKNATNLTPQVLVSALNPANVKMTLATMKSRPTLPGIRHLGLSNCQLTPTCFAYILERILAPLDPVARPDLGLDLSLSRTSSLTKLDLSYVRGPTPCSHSQTSASNTYNSTPNPTNHTPQLQPQPRRRGARRNARESSPRRAGPTPRQPARRRRWRRCRLGCLFAGTPEARPLFL